MYRKPLYGSLLLALILCTLSARPHQQEPAQPQTAPAYKAELRKVLLPVAIRDKKGNAAEIKLSELELVDEGQPQIIESLTRDPGAPFRVGLLADTSRSMSSAMDELRKGVGKFLDGLLPAEANASKDEAFLIHFDRQVELLEDFTHSRERLRRELDQMQTSRATGQPQAPPRSGESGSGDERGRGPGGGDPGNGPEGERSGRRPVSGPQLYDAIYLASDELMKAKDGRKALVVFSDGVDQGSKVSLNEAVDAADRAGVSVYAIYFKGEKESAESGPDSGHRGGIGGWPGGGGGYPGGGRRPSAEEKNSVDGKKILEKIAQRTGGRAYEAKRRENLEEIYPRILDDLRSLYWLTYTPSPVDKEGGFHKVALHTSKNGCEAATREGYYAGAQ
jgi:VWFA-related protein